MALNIDGIDMNEDAVEPEIRDIAENLDAAASPDATSSVEADSDAPTDDEMQRLLDELAGEKKESAQ